MAEPARSLALIPLEVGNVDDYAATLQAGLRSEAIDVVLLPMAVADFEPELQPGKISSDAESLVLHCRRTPKVIRLVRDWSPSVYLVGFKLLSHVSREELIRRAEAACRDNRADLTVANDLADPASGPPHDPPCPPGPRARNPRAGRRPGRSAGRSRSVPGPGTQRRPDPRMSEAPKHRPVRIRLTRPALAREPASGSIFPSSMACASSPS